MKGKEGFQAGSGADQCIFLTDSPQAAETIGKAGFHSEVLPDQDGGIGNLLKKLTFPFSPDQLRGIDLVTCLMKRKANEDLTKYLEGQGMRCRDGSILADLPYLRSDPEATGKALRAFIPSRVGRPLENPLPLEILSHNLNHIPYDQFFHALGYSDQDEVFLRSFRDKGEKDGGMNDQIRVSSFDQVTRRLRSWNEHDRGIFFVVNGDGHKDSDVKHIRAQFIDFDDFPFQEQIRRLNHFPLEPSIIIKTRKSLHCYWIIRDGDVKAFRNIQERLIRFFGSDRSIINESRVMRLYGYEHRKEDPLMVTLLKFDPDLTYTQRDLAECLPIQRKERPPRTARSQSQDLVKHGGRYNYLMSQAGLYMRKLGNMVTDEYIWELVKKDFLEHCEHLETDDLKEVEQRIMKGIRKFRKHDQEEQDDPGFWSYAIKAWNAENPGRTFDRNTMSWDSVRDAGARAKEAGKVFDQDQVRSQGKEPEEKKKPDLAPFHHWKNGNPTKVYHFKIYEYLKNRENIFFLGGVPYIYNDGVYHPNRSGSALKTMIRDLIYQKFITSTTVENIYKLFLQDEELEVTSINELNDHPKHWVHFRNGFYDPIEKRFIEHDPKYRSINQLPHDYHTTGDLPGEEIEKWLNFITPDPEDREMLLQYFGYCMTCDISQEVFLILSGTGGTGKSTLIRMLESVIGLENISNISLKKMEDRFASYGLLGKLLNSCADLETEALSDVSVLKKVTGEDQILVEAKGKDAIFIKSYAKLVFSCNELPIVKAEKTNGVYRRMLVLTMHRTPEKTRTDFFKVLQQQLPYFIRLCVEALGRMYEQGQIIKSKNSQRAVMDLWKESDSVQAFIEDRLIQKGKAERKELFSEYQRYCENMERRALTKKNFFSALRTKGYTEGTIHGKRCFLGLSLPDFTPLFAPRGEENAPTDWMEEENDLPFLN